jgi:transcriptional regulator with XRE-family HTH domain
MSNKRIRFSDQIRRAVDSSGMSRYRICKEAGIDQATFSRFMAGKVGMALPTLDALADVLGLDANAKGQIMKAHDRNTKDFRELTLAQMRASIAAMQKHLNDAKRVYEEEEQLRRKAGKP